MSATHSGGGGKVKDARDLTQPTIWSALSIIVTTASERGTTSTSIRTNVITATASLRLPQSLSWRLSKSGQVATTIVVAQINAVMKGRTTQKLAKISRLMNITASVVRVTSSETLVFVLILGFPP